MPRLRIQRLQNWEASSLAQVLHLSSAFWALKCGKKQYSHSYTKGSWTTPQKTKQKKLDYIIRLEIITVC